MTRRKRPPSGAHTCAPLVALDEAAVQATVIGYLELLEARGLPAFHHSPNEGKRSALAQRQMKLFGTRAGEPDLLIYLAGGRAHLVELKLGQGRVSPAQTARHQQLAALGWPVTILRFQTADQALAQLMAILAAKGLSNLPRIAA